MDLFYEMVSSMYSVNWLVVSSAAARNSLTSRLAGRRGSKSRNHHQGNDSNDGDGTSSDTAMSAAENYSVAEILSCYSNIDNVNGIIRDGKDQTLRVDRLRLKFIDQQEVKTKPTAKAIEKSLYDLVASFKNSPEMSDQETRHTPWYTDWRHEFLARIDPNTDPQEPKEYAGSMAGILFVIDPTDVANYQEVINTLLSEAKSLSGVRWLFSSQIKYIIVIDFNSTNISNSHSQNQSNKTSQEPRRDETVMPGPPVSMDSKWAELSQTYYAFRLHLDENAISISTSSSSKQMNQASHSHSQNDLINHHHQHETHHPPLDNGLILDPLQIAMRSQTPDLHHDKVEGNMMKSSKSSTTLSGSGVTAVESCLRDLVQRAFMPWIDRQVRVLIEAAAKRRGLSITLRGVFRNMTASSTSLTSGYSHESNEMQQRRLGDCFLMLGLADRALTEFRASRRDFELSSGQLTPYWAAASEACAVASYLARTPNSRYFDDAIKSYADTGSILFATRATLIATDLLRTLAPNEAARLFISMTGEDSDLRSGLFLEQAAKCFMQAGSHTRKASFNYVLAAHRYSRCGLRKHAIHCFDRYQVNHAWTHSQENTAYSMVRLCLALSEAESNSNYRYRALKIAAEHSSNEIFFGELIKELLQSNQASIGTHAPYLVKAPRVTDISWTYKDHDVQDQLILHKNPAKPSPCYINEPLILVCTLASHFAMQCSQVKLVVRVRSRRSTGDSSNTSPTHHPHLPAAPPETSAQQHVQCQVLDTIDLQQVPTESHYSRGGDVPLPATTSVTMFNEQPPQPPAVVYGASQVIFELTAVRECFFDVVGLQFTCSSVPLWVELSDKQQTKLRFQAKANLPLLDFGIHINPFPSLPQNSIPLSTTGQQKINLIACQLARITFTVGPNQRDPDWRPSKLTLRSRADIFPLTSIPKDSQDQDIVLQHVRQVISARDPEENLFDGGKKKSRTFELTFGGQNEFYLLAPPSYDEALFHFTVAYHSGSNKPSGLPAGVHLPSHRSLTKALDATLWSCLRLDSFIPLETMNPSSDQQYFSVASLENELPAGYYNSLGGSALLPSTAHWISQQYVTLQDATGAALHVGPSGVGHLLLGSSETSHKTRCIPFKITIVVGHSVPGGSHQQQDHTLGGVLILPPQHQHQGSRH